MEKPAIPDINPQQIEMCAKALILACIGSEAETLTLTQEGFSKDGYLFGDYKVTVEKI